MLMVDMAHFAGLVAGKVFTGDENPVPYAHVTTTTTHKSLRGPRGGMVLAQEEFAADVDRGCPMVLGGPLSHVMAAKAVALRRGPPAGVPDLRAGDRRQREVAGRGLPDPRREARHRRHRQPHRAARRVDVRPHRPPGRVGAARRRRRHQPQLGAGRPQRRLVHLRRPPRHPRAHHPRLRPRRVRPGRRPDRRGPLEHPARHHQGRRPVARRRTCWPTASPTASRPAPPRCSTSTRSTPGSTSADLGAGARRSPPRGGRRRRTAASGRPGPGRRGARGSAAR